MQFNVQCDLNDETIAPKPIQIASSSATATDAPMPSDLSFNLYLYPNLLLLPNLCLHLLYLIQLDFVDPHGLQNHQIDIMTM